MIKDIANTFIQLVSHDLFSHEIELINKKNNSTYYIYNNLCASHDYLDTNIYLLEAIKTHNINFKINSNEFWTLCNKVHSLAIKNNFKQS